ncbi:SMC-Scp complex subunit ScpB [candidate division KSB1 bacterium]|nr:SMC-Scp complex subunit ScpB [candidate division KSB1 bacterium]
MDKQELVRVLEALIFASDSPLSLKQMQSLLAEVAKDDILEALNVLGDSFQDRSFFLKKVAGGYQLASKPEYSQWIKTMLSGKESSRLSRAALETLAIIAFKQPISRVEVNAIRGVNSDGVIRTLLERKLIDMAGRDDGPGRALLFQTTNDFLQYFGIDDITDLPRPKEVEELLAEGEGGKLLQDLPEEQLLKLEDHEDAQEQEPENKTDAESKASEQGS